MLNCKGGYICWLEGGGGLKINGGAIFKATFSQNEKNIWPVFKELTSQGVRGSLTSKKIHYGKVSYLKGWGRPRFLPPGKIGGV